MKCSDCALYKTKECYANPKGEEWDSAENFSCFELKGETSPDVSPSDNQVPIDRQKIYEEEKARAEAQEKIKQEQALKSSKKMGKGCLIVAIVMVVLAMAIAIPIATCDTESTEVDLNVSVSYKDGQFTITNNDDFAWTDVEFDLNYETWSSGYTYHAGRLEAYTTYTVGSMQFTKSDGTMFNPFTQKPLKMSIHCKTPDGKDGWWFGSWE